jgi:hypothetical protein
VDPNLPADQAKTSPWIRVGVALVFLGLAATAIAFAAYHSQRGNKTNDGPADIDTTTRIED